MELEPLTSSCSTAINLRLTSRANSVAHYSNNNNDDNYINDDYDRTFNTSSNWNQNRRYQQSSRYHSGRNNDNLIMNTPLTYLPQPSRYSTQTPSLNSNLSFNRYDRTPSPTRGTTMSRRYSNLILITIIIIIIIHFIHLQEYVQDLLVLINYYHQRDNHD